MYCVMLLNWLIWALVAKLSSVYTLGRYLDKLNADFLRLVLLSLTRRLES
jgi:hypothetical protein